MVITILGCAVLAKVIQQEWIMESSMGIAVMALMMFASILGGMVATATRKETRALSCMGAGGCYFLQLLLITAIFFEGSYTGISVTALVIFGGSAVAFLVGIRENKGRGRKKIRIPNG